MTMIASASGFEYINAVLSADTAFMSYTTGIFRDIAPASQPTPYTILQAQSPPLQVLTENDYRVMSEGLFVVKEVGKAESDMAAMVNAMKRAYELFYRTSGSVADGLVLFCVPVDEIAYSEDTDGVIFSHLGHVLRMTLQ